MLDYPNEASVHSFPFTILLNYFYGGALRQCALVLEPRLVALLCFAIFVCSFRFYSYVDGSE